MGHIAQAIPTERNKNMSHEHKYIYGDIPALGECKCGAYRVFDRDTQTYKEIEKECSFYECYEPTYKSSMNCQYHQPVREAK